METQSHRFTVDFLKEEDLTWFVEVAAVGMLTEELQRPDLVHLDTLYRLARVGMEGKTSFVVKKGDVCAGALGAILTPSLFNPSVRTLAEVFWYVLPEYRNTRAGVLLLNMFTDVAYERADDATLSLLNTSKVNTETLAKRGFNQMELGFIKHTKVK